MEKAYSKREMYSCSYSLIIKKHYTGEQKIQIYLFNHTESLEPEGSFGAKMSSTYQNKGLEDLTQRFEHCLESEGCMSTFDLL